MRNIRMHVPMAVQNHMVISTVLGVGQLSLFQHDLNYEGNGRFGLGVLVALPHLTLPYLTSPHLTLPFLI